jgi:hypothetical protein
MLPLASRNPIDRTARPAVVKKTPVESRQPTILQQSGKKPTILDGTAVLV